MESVDIQILMRRSLNQRSLIQEISRTYAGLRRYDMMIGLKIIFDMDMHLKYMFKTHVLRFLYFEHLSIDRYIRKM